MKLVTFRKEDELLPVGGFLFDEETNTLVSAGVFQDEVRAEAWAQCLGDFLEEHDLTGILLEGMKKLPMPSFPWVASFTPMTGQPVS